MGFVSLVMVSWGGVGSDTLFSQRYVSPIVEASQSVSPVVLDSDPEFIEGEDEESQGGANISLYQRERFGSTVIARRLADVAIREVECPFPPHGLLRLAPPLLT